jgi:TonB family protein
LISFDHASSRNPHIEQVNNGGGNQLLARAKGTQAQLTALANPFVRERVCLMRFSAASARIHQHPDLRGGHLTGFAFRVYVPTVKTFYYLFLSLNRHKLRVVVLLLCFMFPSRYAVSAQSRGIDQLGKTFRAAGIRKVVVSDFVDDGGHVTLQGVLLADRLSFALRGERGFETLNRDRVNMHLYTPTLPKNEPLEKSAINAAQVAGAEAIVLGKIERDAKAIKINITALSVLTGKQMARETFSIPRTREMDELAAQLTQPDGATYLTGQNGVTMPACAYCPNPDYTEEARKNKIEGTVVLTAIINRSGKVENILKVKGLSDGLTEQAMAAVHQWQFKPAQDSRGNAVTVMVPLDVVFRLF